MTRALLGVPAVGRPSRPAIEGPDETLTYGELRDQAQEVATRVTAAGCGAGAPVGVHLPSSPRYVASIVGVLEAGAAFAPLQTDWPGRRINQAVRKVRPSLLLCDAGRENELVANLELEPQQGDPVVISGTADGKSLSDRVAEVRLEYRDRDSGAPIGPVAPDLADRAYVVFTSGSTGGPKAIEGSGAGLAHFVRWEIGELGLGSSARVAQLAPLTFDVSLRDIFVPLLAGGVLCIPEPDVRQHPPRLLQWIIDAEVTLLHVVPTVFRLLLAELEAAPAQAGRLRSLEHVLLAGEALHRSDLIRWRQAVGDRTEIVNLYGPSETTLAKVFWRLRPHEPVPEVVPLGRPLPDTAVLVVEDGRRCGTGEAGEIHILTPFRSHGYLGDPALTSERFIENPAADDREIVYRTGDLGELNEVGELLFRGRVDNQLKIRGNRVDPGEVEAALLGLAGVQEAVVISPSRPGRDPELAAFYVGDAVAETLGAQLHAILPDYMVPASFVPVQEIPRASNGKADRRALEAILQPIRESARPGGEEHQPANTLEQSAHRWWKDALALEALPAGRSFAAMGGSSLAAMKVVASAYHECGLELTVADVRGAPSVAEFGEWVRAEVVKRRRSAPIPPRSEAGPAGLSSAQLRMWDLAAYEPAKVAYNEVAAFEIEGPLDTAACEAVHAALIERHEILRTVFDVVDGEPRQTVRPCSSESPGLQRVSFREGDDPEGRAAQFMLAQQATPLDLATGPCIKVFLLELEQERHIVFAVFYHLIMDQWSHEILVREAAAMYAAVARGARPRLPAPRLQYRDFADWHNRRLGQVELTEEDRLFWQRHLTPAPPTLDLAAARRRPPIKTYNGGRASARLGQDVEAALESLARLEEASFFMIMLTCGYTLVRQWSGQEDLVLGVPVTIRSHPDLESMVGLFLNTLPMRLDTGGMRDFRELLRAVRSTAVACLEHREYPFESIVRDMGMRTPYSRTPLFDVMVATYDDPVWAVRRQCEEASLDLPEGLRARSYPTGSQSSKFDLTMFFVRTEAGIDVIFEYNRDLLDRWQIDRMLEDCSSLLTRVADGGLGLAVSAAIA